MLECNASLRTAIPALLKDDLAKTEDEQDALKLNTALAPGHNSKNSADVFLCMFWYSAIVEPFKRV